jgi:hypothetical protein
MTCWSCARLPCNTIATRSSVEKRATLGEGGRGIIISGKERSTLRPRNESNQKIDEIDMKGREY